jgi:acetylornithine deacetylase
MTPLAELLRQLVAINSINPTLAGGPGEAEITRWIAEWLRGIGLDAHLQEVAPGRPNTIARIPGRGVAPPLLLNAHIDTVGVEDMPAPFELRAEGDRLYGRGVYDMKCGAAVMMGLAEVFRASPPPGDVWLTFVCDEEDVSLGTEALIRDWLPTLPARPAAAIVLEPTEEELGIAHKGFAWFEVTIKGRAAHGSRPEQGMDAIAPLGAAINELVALEQGFVQGDRHPLLGRPSLHASTVQGGSAWSVIPAEATLRWERRTITTEPADRPAQELDQVVAAAQRINDAQIIGRHVFTRYPLDTPADAPLVRALKAAAPVAPLSGVSFWTDGALIGAAGIPTVIYGATGHGAHAIDEWVSTSSLDRVAAVVRRVIETGNYT